MSITTSVAPSAREWAEQKAAELVKIPLAELIRSYEEASGYDKTTAIGIILSCEAPMTDEEMCSCDFGRWNYIIEVEE